MLVGVLMLVAQVRRKWRRLQHRQQLVGVGEERRKVDRLRRLRQRLDRGVGGRRPVGLAVRVRSRLAIRRIHVFRVRQILVQVVNVDRESVFSRFVRKLADRGDVENLDDFVEGHDFVLVGELVDGDELVAVRNVAVKLRRDGEDDGGLGRGVKLAENRTPASGFCRRDGAEPEA